MNRTRSSAVSVIPGVSVTAAIATLPLDHPALDAFRITFLLLMPGLALTRLTRLALSPLELMSLTLAASAALNTIIATLAVYTDSWSTDYLFGLILSTTTALVLTDRHFEGPPAKAGGFKHDS